MNMFSKYKSVFILCLFLLNNNNSFSQEVQDTIKTITEPSNRISTGYKNIAFDTLSAKRIVSALATVKGVDLEKNFL